MDAEPVESAACGNCGSVWFKLEPYASSDGSKGLGVVALDGSGNITSYSGLFECMECLQKLELPQVVVGKPGLVLLK